MNGSKENRSLLLAIETSCDESAVAILQDGKTLLASEIASQIEMHRHYGGVVPEAASRQHLQAITPLLDYALSKANIQLSELDAIAATLGPGLASSLMVGAAVAKGLAIGLNRPFYGVNHIEGHLLSPFFGEATIQPAIGLVVSGGHTLLVEIESQGHYRRLGGTLDDAAGEAFDKVAKLLGLPYPGGPEVDRLAQQGDPTRFTFPRGMLEKDNFDFSFSGLKTAVRYKIAKILPSDAPNSLENLPLADLCASFQQAVVDVLITKTIQAAKKTGHSTIAVSGGVSLNSQLRAQFASACEAEGFKLCLAPANLCTDNAAMIAAAASFAHSAGNATDLLIDIDPNLRLNFLRS